MGIITKRRSFRVVSATISLTLLIFFLFSQSKALANDKPSSLDIGYRLMYNLQFDKAKQEFSQWQQEHPDDPLGPVSEAATELFGELTRLGILEAQFFVKDSFFQKGEKLQPDQLAHQRFDRATERAESLANTRIATKPNDTDALFGLALVYGLRSDYTELIERDHWDSLKLTRQASNSADKLLQISPNYYDAYLATGMGKYVVGSLVAPVRWVLTLAGFHGDKKQGMKEVELTAQHGRFLAPFARILLAIAYLRDNNRDAAYLTLEKLRDEFPGNSLFTRELARLDGKQN